MSIDSPSSMSGPERFTPLRTVLSPERILADLLWLMQSPGLLDAEDPRWRGLLIDDATCARLLAQAAAEIETLKCSPTTLADYVELTRRSGRLGHYFEALMEFWLRRLIRTGRVHAGVAIRRGRETLGELDFIFDQGPGTPATHWEAAVKFYMCIALNEAESQDPAQYVGQRLLDRLDLKVSRSMEHQLPLALRPEALERISELEMSAPVSRLFMKGRLFYPITWDWQSQSGPVGTSPNHPRGWWSAWDAECFPESLSAASVSRWLILPKELWLSDATALDETSLLESDQLRHALARHFEVGTDALQVAQMRQVGDARWREISRGMVLRSGWPESARGT